MNPLCIFHDHCVDGHCSAWVVHHALGDAVDFRAASYGDPPPDVAGRDVVIVDFSYKRDVLEGMAREARSVLVLDHHRSAQEDLADLMHLDGRDTWGEWLIVAQSQPHLLGTIFDMKRSGAGLTWDFFNPGKRGWNRHSARPWFVNLVEDRDLWRFTDPRSRPFHAAVTSYPPDFALWDRLYKEVLHNSDPMEVTNIYEEDKLLREGTAILRKHDLDVQQVIATTRRTMVIGGVRVPVCNCPPWMASDVGNALCEPMSVVDVPAIQTAPMTPDSGPVHIPHFSATYYDRDGQRSFSLRSRAAGADVSEVARRYGGGGHRNASGFSGPVGWEGDT